MTTIEPPKDYISQPFGWNQFMNAKTLWKRLFLLSVLLAIASGLTLAGAGTNPSSGVTVSLHEGYAIAQHEGNKTSPQQGDLNANPRPETTSSPAGDADDDDPGFASAVGSEKGPRKAEVKPIPRKEPDLPSGEIVIQSVPTHVVLPRQEPETKAQPEPAAMVPVVEARPAVVVATPPAPSTPIPSVSERPQVVLLPRPTPSTTYVQELPAAPQPPAIKPIELTAKCGKQEPVVTNSRPAVSSSTAEESRSLLAAATAMLMEAEPIPADANKDSKAKIVTRIRPTTAAIVPVASRPAEETNVTVLLGSLQEKLATADTPKAAVATSRSPLDSSVAASPKPSRESGKNQAQEGSVIANTTTDHEVRLALASATEKLLEAAPSPEIIKQRGVATPSEVVSVPVGNEDETAEVAPMPGNANQEPVAPMPPAKTLSADVSRSPKDLASVAPAEVAPMPVMVDRTPIAPKSEQIVGTTTPATTGPNLMTMANALQEKLLVAGEPKGNGKESSVIPADVAPLPQVVDRTPVAPNPEQIASVIAPASSKPSLMMMANSLQEKLGAGSTGGKQGLAVADEANAVQSVSAAEWNAVSYAAPTAPSPAEMKQAKPTASTTFFLDQRRIGEVKAVIGLTPGDTPSNTAAELAKEGALPALNMPKNDWSRTCCYWDAPSLAHRPLYFEEINLERYGYTTHCPYVVQPIVSGARFFATVPILPYRLVAEPWCEPVYTLGQYRPGSCVPNQWNMLPLSVTGATAESAVAAGLILAVP